MEEELAGITSPGSQAADWARCAASHSPEERAWALLPGSPRPQPLAASGAQVPPLLGLHPDCQEPARGEGTLRTESTLDN